MFLTRRDGEFKVLRIWLGGLDDDTLPDDRPADTDAETYITLSGAAAEDAVAIRSACGAWPRPRGARALPFFGACLPLHTSLHNGLQKEFTEVDFAAIADDCYNSAPVDIRSTIYDAFARVRQVQLQDLNFHLNMSKVKAINPLGGVANITPDILEEQEGEIIGFKCAGAFVAPATRDREGDAWGVVAALTKVFKKRLEPLVRVDTSTLTLDLARKADGKLDHKKLRFDLLKTCANAMPAYWIRCMPARITRPTVKAAVVDDPIRASFELISNAEPTPAN
jgi:hypothetical protein